MEDNNGCGILLLILVLIAFAIWGTPRFLQTKYEGRTAQEWFNQADYWESRYLRLQSCVEDSYSNNYCE